MDAWCSNISSCSRELHISFKKKDFWVPDLLVESEIEKVWFKTSSEASYLKFWDHFCAVSFYWIILKLGQNSVHCAYQYILFVIRQAFQRVLSLASKPWKQASVQPSIGPSQSQGVQDDHSSVHWLRVHGQGTKNGFGGRCSKESQQRKRSCAWRFWGV